MQELPNELKEYLVKEFHKLKGESIINMSLFDEMKKTNLYDFKNKEEFSKKIEFVIECVFNQGQLMCLENILNFTEEKFGK
jgi:hypothetical protein